MKMHASYLHKTLLNISIYKTFEAFSIETAFSNWIIMFFSFQIILGFQNVDEVHLFKKINDEFHMYVKMFKTMLQKS